MKKGKSNFKIIPPRIDEEDLQVQTLEFNFEDEEQVCEKLIADCVIENQDIKIKPKDKIEITGSRITFEGKPAIIAAFSLNISETDEYIFVFDISNAF